MNINIQLFHGMVLMCMYIDNIQCKISREGVMVYRHGLFTFSCSFPVLMCSCTQNPLPIISSIMIFENEKSAKMVCICLGAVIVFRRFNFKLHLHPVSSGGPCCEHDTRQSRLGGGITSRRGDTLFSMPH